MRASARDRHDARASGDGRSRSGELRRRCASVLLVAALLACSGGRDAPAREGVRLRAPAPPTSVAEARPLPPSTFAAPERLVAIGDVHGDLAAFTSALRAAGAIDQDARWIGGALFVVQTGDLLDRGADERAILDLVERLGTEAEAAGGHLIALDGNHEIMNARGDFRYVTPAGFADFDSFARGAHEHLPARVAGRTIAFRPGGAYARLLASHPIILRVGDTLLVHGGAQAQYLRSGLASINEASRAFLLGEAPLAPALEAPDGPLWFRGFAQAGDEATCAALGDALDAAEARRMVVGHTVQETGITSACDDRVFRIDVGLSRFYGGPIEVLEITATGTRIVRGAIE